MEKEFDVIVIGELNVDIILNGIEKFPEIGKEILAEEMTVTLGSSSAIFASNLSSLGSKVAFIGKVGNDSFAGLVKNSLKNRNVETSQVMTSASHKTGATIVMSYGEDRANVTYAGAMNDLTIHDIDFEFLAKARHLHFSSVFLQPGIKKALPEIFKKAKALGLTTSIDPQWDPLEKWDIDMPELMPYLDIFMPNLKELENIAHTEGMKEAIKSLKHQPKFLIIKDGSNGAHLWDGKKMHHQGIFENKQIVDCIGAGDSFNAGFIHKFVSGKSIAECLEFGALTGAISTTAAGGTGAFSDYQGIARIAKSKFNQTI
ncbi:MAG: carbohydrate kinase family protein [Bacteroidales bacterium]